MKKKPDPPPIPFDRNELSALHLGLRSALGSLPGFYARAAGTALAKIRAALPKEWLEVLAANRIASVKDALDAVHSETMGRAIRGREKLDLGYADAGEVLTRRRIRPLAIIYVAPGWSLIAWCELRNDFRQFRLDRIRSLEATGETFRPVPGQNLEDFFAAAATG